MNKGVQIALVDGDFFRFGCTFRRHCTILESWVLTVFFSNSSTILTPFCQQTLVEKALSISDWGSKLDTAGN